MADIGPPFVIMGRFVWPKLAEPAALQSFGAADLTLITWAIIIASVFVVFGLCLSFYLLFEHLSGYNEPKEQKWLIGIILMVPVYTITSVSVFIIKFCFNFDLLQNCGRLLRGVRIILLWAVSYCLLGRRRNGCRETSSTRSGGNKRAFVG